jgi:parvulin-like peptidyl-prolyl isomerase
MRHKYIGLGLGLLLLVVIGCTSPTPTQISEQAPATAIPPTSPAEQEAPAATTIPPTATPKPRAAQVNGEPITMAEFERQMANYEASMSAIGEDPNTPEGQQALTEARKMVLDWMIQQKLLAQDAERRGISVSEAEVDQVIQDLIADIGEEAFEERIAEQGLSREMVRAMFKEQLLASEVMQQVIDEVPPRATHVNARHILVPTEEEAQRLLRQIQAGADFAELAQTYSQDAFTREQGGDLGYFPRGILTSQAVEDAAFGLQPGQVSDVVKSELGYHVVKVVDRVDDMEISPENLQELRRKAEQTYLDRLHEEADIQRFVSFSNEAAPDS